MRLPSRTRRKRQPAAASASRTSRSAPGPHGRGDAGDQRTLRRAVDQVQHVEDGRQVDGLGQPRLARIGGLDLGGVAQRVASEIGGTGTQFDAVQAQPGRRRRPPVRRPVPVVGLLGRLRDEGEQQARPAADVDQHARRRQPARRQHRAIDGIAAQLGAREFPGGQRRAEIAIRRGRREPREAGIAKAPAHQRRRSARRRRARRRCSGPCRRAAGRARNARGPSTRTRPWTARRCRRGAATSPAGPPRRGRQA